MSTHDLKVRQAGAGSDLDGCHTHTDPQDVTGHEKLHPGPSAQHNTTESQTRRVSTSRHATGQQKSTRDLQIRQIIVLRPNKDACKISEDKSESSRFATVISISLPTIRNKTATDTEETLPDSDIAHETVKKTANQIHTELRDRFSTRDGPNAPFNEDSFITLQRQHGLNTPNQGRDTGIQHNLGLQTQIANKDLQINSTQSVCTTQAEVSKGTNVNKESGANDYRENVLTSQNHSNLTSHEKDNSLTASTDCELFACRSKVLNQVLSLTSLQTPHSESSCEPEQSLLNPASTMLASALATVLAPPWSGRLRRPKQSSSEVQQEPQDCGHNVNPSSSLHQDRWQRSFLASQRQQGERALQDPNDNDMQFTAGTSCSSPDWQKENNSPNVTTTTQSKRAVVKSFSVDTYRATMYNHAELSQNPTPPDTGQVPKLSHSEEHRGYRTSKNEDKNEPFKSLSSKPTTSSLLLSLRRANLRKSIAETTQMQTQQDKTTRSLRSLTLPSRSILKNSQLFTSSVTPDEQTEDTLGSSSFPDSPSRTEEISDTNNFLFSPRSKRTVTRTPLFPNKTDTDFSKIPEAFIARDDEQQFLNSTNKSSPHEMFKAQQNSHSLLLRKYSNTGGGDPVEQSTANNANQENSNANNNSDTLSQNSPKDKANLNKDIPQTDFNVRNIKSQNATDCNSVSTRSFTDTLNISPKKENFSVDAINRTNLDSRNSSQASQSPMDLSNPLSPSRPTRGFHVPSIYSYLRESSPAAFTPYSPFTPSSKIHKVENSSSPLQGEKLHSDRKPSPSRFSFDISPTEQQEQASKTGSPNSLIGPAQSLPPDFGRKSAPRLSSSPYSTLISSRPALKSTLLSSPPASKPRRQSTSNDVLTIRVYPIKDDQSPSSSRYKSKTKEPKKQLATLDREQKTANTVQAYSCALGNHKPVQPCLSQTAPDASQSTNKTPHPEQQNTNSHEEHDGLVVQLNKSNSSCKYRQKENTVTAESETLHAAEKKIADLHTHERLQEIPNSKKLRVKKDNVLTPDSVADSDDVTPQYLKTKRNVPVLKTSSRIDQVLNRLKQTFGGKRSDSTVETKHNKTTIQQSLDAENFERAKREEKKCSESLKEPSLINDKTTFTSLSQSGLMKSEKTHVDGQKDKGEKQCFGSQQEAPDSSMNTVKALTSQESLSPLTESKHQNTLNVDVQKRVNSEKHFANQSRTPNSSLITDKPSLSSQESLSPLTERKFKNTQNEDMQNKIKREKQHFTNQWAAPNSSLTTGKVSLTSQESLSPLTSKKAENTLNVDVQNKVKWEKQHFTNQWAAPNSPLTTGKVSLPSQESLSPLAFRKSECILNVDRQNRIMGDKQHFGSQWRTSDLTLTTDKAPLPSQKMLSPLPLRKAENTLNVDGQNWVTGEKQTLVSQWKASNSFLTNDTASLPFQESLSPLTLEKSQNSQIFLDGQNRAKSEKQCYGSHWGVPNSSLTTDKGYLPSLESVSPITFRRSKKTIKMDQHKRWSDDNGKRSYSSSPHKLKAHGMNRSATLPHYRHSVGPPSPIYIFDYDSEDIQNDVFYSPVSKKSNSLCESDSFPHLRCAKSPVQHNLRRSRLSSSCADLKYGLNNGRSFSVSSVVSSRPSGPGRISTSSISDLSSLDDCVQRAKYSGTDSPIHINYSPTYGSKSVTSDQSQHGSMLPADYLHDTDQQENSSCFWDDADPTPPPSPTVSPSRRISQAASVSSPIWTSPDSPSPRGVLSSRSYSTSFTVFEESGSDTTTDDEYCLENGDEVETEL